MQIKGRTLSLNEGKLQTSDVAYKKGAMKASDDQEDSEDKTEEVSIVDETTSKETNVTEAVDPKE